MFYDTFVELCTKKGVKPTRAALDMGLSKATPTLWKNNGYTPRGDIMNKIAAYFEVSVDYLLGNKQTEEPQSDQIDLSDVELGFLGDYKELTEENKATVRDMVRLMRERQKEG